MYKEIEDFLEGHRSQVKPKTIESYRIHLEQFSKWLRRHDLHPHDVSRRDLKKYIGYLKDENYAPKTRRNKFAPVRVYYKDEYYEGEINENPAEKFKTSDAGKDKTKLEKADNEDKRVFLTEDEIEKLINNVPNPQIRNRTIIFFQYHTGLRRQEVADTKLEDLDRDKRKVTVTGKSDKRITAFWMPSLNPLLDAWIDTYRKKSAIASESPYLFLSKYNESISGDRINKIVKKAAKKAGLQKKTYTMANGKTRYLITSHTIRHSFGANWLRLGGNTEGLQRRFAHTDAQTTEEYKHQLDDWVKKESEAVGVGSDIDVSPDIEIGE